MDKEEALEILSNIVKTQGGGHRDLHDGHLIADDTLCELLTSLGFTDIVSEYKKVRKWYA